MSLGQGVAHKEVMSFENALDAIERCEEGRDVCIIGFLISRKAAL